AGPGGVRTAARRGPLSMPRDDARQAGRSRPPLRGRCSMPRAAGSVLRFAALASIALLAACSARPRAVVVERSLEQRPPPPVVTSRDSGAPREYVVQRGDTLYGIAFRHGVDHRDLARWNRLDSPHLIYPGQRLALSGPAADAASAPRTAPPA